MHALYCFSHIDLQGVFLCVVTQFWKLVLFSFVMWGGQIRRDVFRREAREKAYMDLGEKPYNDILALYYEANT